MKMIKIAPGFVLLVACCSHTRMLAQEGWIPIGAPNITNISFQTVGGITYFTHTSSVEWCRRVSSGPVNRSETNLFQTINEEAWTGVCGCEPCIHSETHVSVFGALPSGEYLVQLSSTTLQPQTFRWISFTVPVSDTPTLRALVETNHFNLAVAGVPNVRYIVEASATLTNWAPIVTNIGAPFIRSEAIAPETPERFYRVRIVGE